MKASQKLVLLLATYFLANTVSVSAKPPEYCNARPLGKPGIAIAATLDPTLVIGEPLKGLGKDQGYGVDSVDPVSDALISQLNKKFGSYPLFWGRYISNRPEWLLKQSEVSTLAKYGIRVLPLAQQTMRFNDIDAKTKSLPALPTGYAMPTLS
jgi:hypothetical protein